METVTIIYLPPLALYRNICRDVGGKSILPSVLVVMLMKNLPLRQPLTILPIKFLRLEKSLYRDETWSQYTGHPGSTYREKKRRDYFNSPQPRAYF